MKYSSVPTKEQVLVPETLLKKRKSQEKARAEKSAEIADKKKVRIPGFFFGGPCRGGVV
jgi:large subunit ribosomal protein L7e